MNKRYVKMIIIISIIVISLIVLSLGIVMTQKDSPADAVLDSQINESVDNPLKYNVSLNDKLTYKVILDGKPVNIRFFTKYDTLYFNMQTLLDEAGWTNDIYIDEDSKTFSVAITKYDYKCFFTESDEEITVSTNYDAERDKSWKSKLDKEIIISENSLFVPLKFVKEILRLDMTIDANQIILNTMKDHTLLVYMVASDLESEIGPGNPEGAATADLKELMQVGSTNLVNVVIETGGTKKWNNDIIKGTSVKRWYVGNGSMELIADIGGQNMGGSKGLESFIKWGMLNYPAESYTLILWDHGGGPLLGYGYDEISNDKLTIKELKTSLDDACNFKKEKFETIVFDACIMNTLEIADALSQYASYMVASQAPLSAQGLDYSVMVSLLEQDNNPEYSSFSYNLVNQYKDYAAKMGFDDYFQLSAIKLNKVKKVIPQLNGFIKEISEDMDKDPLLAYEIAIARSENFDMKDEDLTGGGKDLTDLTSLIASFKYIANGKYEDKVQDLGTEIYDCVDNKTSSNIATDFSGISIYMPLTQFKDPLYEKNYLTLYKDIDFSSEYTSFIENYYKKIMLSDCKIDITKNVTTGTYKHLYETIDALLLKVTRDSAKKIYKVDSVVEINNKETGKKTIISTYPANLNRTSGEIFTDLHAYNLNGQNVSMLYAGRLGAAYDMFTIPVLLNDKEANLVVIKKGVDTYFVDSVQYLQVNQTGMSRKRYIKPKSTDIIEPVFVSKGSNGTIEKIPSHNKFSFDAGKIVDLNMETIKDKLEIYYNIELFNHEVIESNHINFVTNN